MSGAKKQNTVELATALVETILEELGLYLWDVKFEKEGSNWYLRYFIEKDDGVNIQDCEDVSRAVSAKLDENDPIPQAYILEVGSPGIERSLTKDWHFQEYLGNIVHVKLFKPVENNRDFFGELISKDGENIVLLLDHDSEDEDIEMEFTQKEAVFVKLVVDFDTGGSK